MPKGKKTATDLDLGFRFTQSSQSAMASEAGGNKDNDNHGKRFYEDEKT